MKEAVQRRMQVHWIDSSTALRTAAAQLGTGQGAWAGCKGIKKIATVPGFVGYGRSDRSKIFFVADRFQEHCWSQARGTLCMRYLTVSQASCPVAKLHARAQAVNSNWTGH